MTICEKIKNKYIDSLKDNSYHATLLQNSVRPIMISLHNQTQYKIENISIYEKHNEIKYDLPYPEFTEDDDIQEIIIKKRLRIKELFENKLGVYVMIESDNPEQKAKCDYVLEYLLPNTEVVLTIFTAVKYQK